MTFMTKTHMLPGLMAAEWGGGWGGHLPLSEGLQQMLTIHSHLDSVFRVCGWGSLSLYRGWLTGQCQPDLQKPSPPGCGHLKDVGGPRVSPWCQGEPHTSCPLFPRGTGCLASFTLGVPECGHQPQDDKLPLCQYQSCDSPLHSPSRWA